MAIILSL